MKHIFTDIDGTLCYRDKETKKQIIPENTVKTINKLRKDGHKVYIATGRSLFSAKEVMKDLEFDGYLCSCGAYFQVGDEVLIDEALKLEDLEFIKKSAKKYHVALMFECKECNFVDETWQEELKKYRDKSDLRYWVDLSKYDETPVYKISFKADNANDFLNFENEIKAHYEICYGVNPEDFFGEISKLNNSKGSVIKKLIKLGYLKYEESIAIGDSPNDIEMLKQASVGIAMGNARDKIKAYGDFITSDVREDGFYKAFYKLDLVGDFDD